MVLCACGSNAGQFHKGQVEEGLFCIRAKSNLQGAFQTARTIMKTVNVVIWQWFKFKWGSLLFCLLLKSLPDEAHYRRSLPRSGHVDKTKIWFYKSDDCFLFQLFVRILLHLVSVCAICIIPHKCFWPEWNGMIFLDSLWMCRLKLNTFRWLSLCLMCLTCQTLVTEMHKRAIKCGIQ